MIHKPLIAGTFIVASPNAAEASKLAKREVERLVDITAFNVTFGISNQGPLIDLFQYANTQAWMVEWAAEEIDEEPESVEEPKWDGGSLARDPFEDHPVEVDIAVLDEMEKSVKESQGSF